MSTSTFTISRPALAKELSLLIPIAEAKGTIPVLSNVLLEYKDNFRLTATDLAVTLTSEIAVPDRCEPFSYCLPLHQLATLTRLFDGDEVSFTKRANERVEVKCGKSKHLLISVPAASFPQAEKIADGLKFTADVLTLREAVSRALPCVSKEESRWTLQGVNFEGEKGTLRIVATDGKILGFTSLPYEGSEPVKMLVPAKALKSFLALESETVAITADANQISFQCGTRTLTSRLLLGEFPEWALMIPKDMPYSVQIPVDALRRALSRISVTRETRFVVGAGKVLGGAKFTFTKSELIAETRQSDQGQSEEPISITSNLNGDGIEIGINPDYLSSFLAQSGESVTCEIKDPQTQLKFTDGDFQFVVALQRL